MKSNRKNRFISVILSTIMIIGVLSVSGERVLADKDATTGLLYTISGSSAQIIGFTPLSTFDGYLSIPATIAGANVTSIGNSAFSWKTNLISLSIPSGVTTIGESICYGCTGLTSVSIPSSVTSIGNYAFYGCTSLTSISLPNSPVSFGGEIFCGCTSLTSVTIPSSVTTIGVGMFYECSKLSVVTFSGTVTSIGDIAFDDDMSSHEIIFAVPIGSKAQYASLLTAKVLGSSMAVLVETPAIPTALTAVSAGPDSVKISWASVTGATGYAIYRSKLSMFGRSNPFAYTASSNYNDLGLTQGATYYYKVRAYTTVGTTNIYGLLTSAVEVIPTASPTPTPKPTPTPTPTASPTPTLTSQPTITQTPAPSETAATQAQTTPTISPTTLEDTADSLSPASSTNQLPTYVFVLIALGAVLSIGALVAGAVVIWRRIKRPDVMKR
jgi:hypothetical protein